MSPWTSLLESLHSALIDEIAERHPEPKPELGMPMRQNRFALPGPLVESVLMVEVSFESSRGIALIASNSACLKSLRLTHQTLWASLLKRADSEFIRREIRPKMGQVVQFKATDPIPRQTLDFKRVIWIPIRIPAGDCFFGIGA